MGRILDALRRLIGRRAEVEQQVSDELDYHLEMLVQENVEAGMDPDEAGRAARRRFGSYRRTRRSGGSIRAAALRERRRARLLSVLSHDLRHAARGLARQPLWTGTAVATLALAIGGTTAIYAIVHAVVFRPLPFAEPDRLVAVHQLDVDDRDQWPVVTLPAWETFRGSSPVLEDVAAWVEREVTVNLTGTAERLRGATVSANLLEVLGVRPLAGRGFRPEEDEPGSPGVALISRALAETRLGGVEEALGTTIHARAGMMGGGTGDTAHTVIGVMDDSFGFPAERVQVWLPFAGAIRDAEIYYLRMLGRLQEGVGLAQATAWADAARLEVPEDDDNRTYGASLRPLHDEIVGDTRTLLLFFLAAVGAVLLIACINVVNLILIRAAGRQRELTIRAALGAGRGRIAAWLLTESLLLGAGGGLLGAGLAVALMRATLLLNPEPFPRQHEVGTGLAFLGFLIVVTVGVGLAVGLLPALRAGRADLARGLGDGGRGFTGGRRQGRTRQVLVVAQLALTTALLVGAGLLLRSFVGLWSTDPGFDAGRVLLVETAPPDARYPETADLERYYTRLRDDLRALPGVASVGLASTFPLSGSYARPNLDVEGYEAAEDERVEALSYRIDPGYLEALRIPLLEGTGFDPDTLARPDTLLVNRALVRRYLPDGRAVGRRISFDGGEDWLEIAGVVGDVHQLEIEGEVEPQLFLPWSEEREGPDWPYSLAVFVRTAGPPLDLAPQVRKLVQSLDPEVPVDIRTMADRVDEAIAAPRFRTLVLAAFGLTGLLLSVVGVYGVTAHAVGQRRREVGVRIALGARRRGVVRAMVGRGSVATLLGIALGSAGAWIGADVLEAWLVGVSTRDPITYGLAVVALTLTSLAAAWVPARRAARVDPVEVLRSE